MPKSLPNRAEIDGLTPTECEAWMERVKIPRWKRAGTRVVGIIVLTASVMGGMAGAPSGSHLIPASPVPRHASNPAPRRTPPPSRKRATAAGDQRPLHFATDTAAEKPWRELGRLKHLADFRQVMLDGVVYDLSRRTKARVCLQLLAARESFGPESALHFERVIDPHVRTQCKLEPLPANAEVKPHHYFNPSKGSLARLGRKLVVSAGAGSGCYYLNVH